MFKSLYIMQFEGKTFYKIEEGSKALVRAIVYDMSYDFVLKYILQENLIPVDESKIENILTDIVKEDYIVISHQTRFKAVTRQNLFLLQKQERKL